MNSKQVVMKKMGRMALVVGLIAVFASSDAVNADTIKMNDGSELTGKIVLEGSDFVKIELQTSSTIKESKMIKKSDIKQVLKTAPDDLEWDKIQKLVPTRSLTTASSYRTMIETGPKAFLATYPNSVHAAKVGEILKTLNEEMDKVERGFQKIEDEWFSPEDRANFTMQVEAKKRYLAMKNQVAQRNLPAYVQAMRNFQVLDENFFGTPGHAKALAGTKELLPVIGQTATRFLRDVNARNEQFNRDKELLDAGAKAQVMAAREREEMVYQKNLAADKAAGIKWVGVNIRSAESLTGLISLVKAEMERLKAIDEVALAARAEQLFEADKLLAEDKLVEAKVVVSKIEEMPGEGKLKTSSSKKKKGTSGGKTTGPTAKSYFIAIAQKLADKTAAETQAAADAAAEAEAAKVVGNTGKKDKDAATATAGGDDEPSKEGDAAAETPGRKNILGVIAKSDEPEEKEEPKETKKKTVSKAKKKGGTDWEAKRKEAEARKASGGGGGGGLPIWVYTVGIAAILGIVVGVMKVMGIGGAKDE